MKGAATFLAGALVAALIALGVVSLRRAGEKADAKIESLLKADDHELLARADEIRALEGVEGRMMLALLACVGARAKGAGELRAVKESLAKAESSQPVVRADALVRNEDAESRVPAPAAPTPTAAPSVAAVPAITPATPTGSSTVISPADAPGFCQQVRPGALRSEPTLFDALFGAIGGALPGDAEYGIVTQASGDLKALLDSRACPGSAPVKLSGQQKEQSRFFRELRGKVFAGRMFWVRKEERDRRPQRAHVHFNPSQRPALSEYLVVYSDEQGEVVHENRFIPAPAGSSSWSDPWRLNPCSRSVALLQERCPWQTGDEFDLEYKDWLYVEPQRRLAANVYCRRKRDLTWVRLARLELSPSSN